MKCKHCKQKYTGIFKNVCDHLPNCPDYYVGNMGMDGVEFSKSRMPKKKVIVSASATDKRKWSANDEILSQLNRHLVKHKTFDGRIDKVKTFDRKLTRAEITEFYNKGAGSFTPTSESSESSESETPTSTSSESSTREQDSSSTPYEKIKDIKKKKIRIENEIQLRRLGYKVTKKKPMIHFISQEDVICMELRQDKKARLQVYYNNNYKVGDEIRCIDGAFIITTMKRVTDVKGKKMYDILSLNQVVERY